MSRRRYRMADNPAYHKAFDSEKQFSLKNPALNPDAYKLCDRAGCESLQKDLLKKIEERTRRLKEIEQRFAQHQTRCQMEGRHYPENIQDEATTFREWLEAAARLDVAMEEMDLCQERLESFVATEQRQRASDCLQYGPIGIGKLREGHLAVIDGQTVRRGEDGILRIEDPNSPYSGMAIECYKAFVVTPFQLARAEKQKKAMEDLIRLQRENPALALPANPPHMGISKINKSDLPPWPTEIPQPEAI